MTFPKDWSELLQCLRSRNVDFVVVGAHAVAFHAIPRATGDLDLFIRPTPENVACLLQALADFGFNSLGLTADAFLQGHSVVQLGYPPNRIDLMTSLSGVDADTVWSGRTSGTIGGQEVYIIGRDALLANKRATDRPKDRFDISTLESMERP